MFTRTFTTTGRRLHFSMATLPASPIAITGTSLRTKVAPTIQTSLGIRIDRQPMAMRSTDPLFQRAGDRFGERLAIGRVGNPGRFARVREVTRLDQHGG